MTSKDGEVQPVLGRRGDAGLVGAVEGVGRLVDPLRGSSDLVAVGEAADARRPDRERTRAGGSEEPSAGERPAAGSSGWEQVTG